MNLIKVIRYRDFLKSGAGKYVRDLGKGYSIVLNEKVIGNTFVIMRAEELAELFSMLGISQEQDKINEVLENNKAKTSERYKITRSLRKS